jgi:hypothetical protein|tara:strand:- start:296 stop:436 length:141 start_codon:yes stop_codon:yes gene_type:complete
MSDIIKGPHTPPKYGDWSKVPGSEMSFRAKRGILREDPPASYKTKK